MRVATPVPEQLEGKMVKHLMCTGRREWDKGAVRDILDERDAELVTCHRECRDTLYWAEDHRGRNYFSSSFAIVDNIYNLLNATAPIGDDGEEGADDWVGSRIYVEFGGKGFLRVFVKLMMKMAINGNGRKVVKRIDGEIIDIFAILSLLLSAV
nr:uncharacterized protein LOC109146973 [Ipomoea batatas]GMC89535.1 uncharacterized protein LOC109146973 [Ipomoea batatas]